MPSDEPMDSGYSDAKTWKDVCGISSAISGGGQADAFRARLNGVDANDVFLKVLRHQSDPGRRARMHREVEAYRTLSHPGIPELLTSNAQHWGDASFKLFLVTSWVEGPTLTKFIGTHGPLQLEEAQALLTALLNIVAYCHENEVIHRDIKPDNILLRNGDVNDPVLCDFGLSFNGDADNQATEHAEELGNRFLRLPELASASHGKRDPRSDLTFLAGVFMFSLTGAMPHFMMAEDGTLPHQRSRVSKWLATLNVTRARSIAGFFDRAFQMNIDRRWQTAQDMRSAVGALGVATTQAQTDEERIEAIRERLHAPHTAERERNDEKLKRVLKRINVAMAAAQSRFPYLINHQAGMRVDAQAGIAENMLALTPASQSAVHYVAFRVEVVGIEIVISATYRNRTFPPLPRLSLAEPTSNTELEAALERIFYVQIDDVVV